jgi:hypothetical protein
MSFKSENLGLSLTEQRQAEIDINTTCKSVKEMSKNTERQDLFVDSKSWFIRHWMIQTAVNQKFTEAHYTSLFHILAAPSTNSESSEGRNSSRKTIYYVCRQLRQHKQMCV